MDKPPILTALRPTAALTLDAILDERLRELSTHAPETDITAVRERCRAALSAVMGVALPATWEEFAQAFEDREHARLMVTVATLATEVVLSAYGAREDLLP